MGSTAAIHNVTRRTLGRSKTLTNRRLASEDNAVKGGLSVGRAPLRVHSYADNSQQEGFTPNRIALKGMTPELEGRRREEPCSEGDWTGLGFGV